MTENIIESNKMIAEFMGLDVFYDTCVRHESTDKNKVTVMKYNTSFDWLMPVKRRIIETPYKDDKSNFLICDFQTTNVDSEIQILITPNFKETFGYINITGLNEITVLYQAIVKFITWYNQNKN